MTQLKQLYKLDKFSAEEIQEYINRLDYDIVENKKAFRTGIVNGFMGILRNAEEYSVPKGYESPMDQLMREEIEKKKAYLEKRKKMESDLFDISYQTWLIDQSEDTLVKIEEDIFKK